MAIPRYNQVDFHFAGLLGMLHGEDRVRLEQMLDEGADFEALSTYVRESMEKESMEKRSIDHATKPIPES